MIQMTIDLYCGDLGIPSTNRLLHREGMDDLRPIESRKISRSTCAIEDKLCRYAYVSSAASAGEIVASFWAVGTFRGSCSTALVRGL